MFVLPQSEIDSIRSELKLVERMRVNTQAKIDRLRETLQSAGFDEETLVIANGSYARHESSSESDLDFYLLCKDEDSIAYAEKKLEDIQSDLMEIAGKPPGQEGAFGKAHAITTILDNIGGDNDTNKLITRRVLFLLEGFGITEEQRVDGLRDNLIRKYVKNSITSHQIALFLLNDIIRYYRTICVDFEFKTVGAPDPKPWGTRNIKLVFSRKLLYFSGLLAVAETAQCASEKKIDTLNQLFKIPVVDRVIACCGAKAVPALKHYEHFLCQMAKGEIREKLDKVEIGNPNDDACFRDLKDCGHHFSWESYHYSVTLMTHRTPSTSLSFCDQNTSS